VTSQTPAAPAEGDETHPPQLPPRIPEAPQSLLGWLFSGPVAGAAPHHHQTYPWWKVMCLTGVDYFSTLGYQPGIAFLAAGALSPIATLLLVLVTLFVALPVYAEVAEKSPHGQGSIHMLEELLPRWRGKLTVLVLLGFAFTDFVITITLSAADAAAHIIHNPYAPDRANHPVFVTLFLLAILGGIFLRGFREAIGLAVVIVAVYLGLNLVVLTTELVKILQRPEVIARWSEALFQQHASISGIAVLALLVFPKLALGLSGFETGVAVMPLVKGSPDDDPVRPVARIRNTRRLLFTAAVTMSLFLIGSSFATTLLIPAHEFGAGGKANGRALAYIAHSYLGRGFGTAYDVSTIAILWFAGASAMAALLNLVPRYLPPYGMAPDWASANRPLVVIFTAITFAVTILFQADVDAQGGAYATGVLVLMTSAAVAVTIASGGGVWRYVYGAMTLIFVYTTLENIRERPEGIKIASFFIVAIVGTSFVSRAFRSTELRIGSVSLSSKARQFLEEDRGRPIRIIAHRPDKRTAEEYAKKEGQAREDHSLDDGEPVIFLEVTQGDASEFKDDLEVRGVRIDRHRILRCQSPAIPNAIAALLLHVRDQTGEIPHAYFGWTEGSPLSYALKYVFLGEGDTAPVTREVLRKAVKEPLRRPRIHVG
jgi:hypothetical protein